MVNIKQQTVNPYWVQRRKQREAKRRKREREKVQATSNKPPPGGEGVWVGPAHKRAASNCRASICHVDTHIVAGAEAQGHRRKCDVLSCSKKFLKMRCFDIVNLTNGGKNGIKIRLHKYRHQQLEQARSRHSSWFLLDSDGSGYAECNRKELERNFIPDLIFTKSWTWTLDRGPGTKSYNSMAEKAYWLWNQCWRKIQSQMAASSNQFYCFGCRQPSCLFSKRAGAAGIVSPPTPGEKSPGFFYAWIIINNCWKAQASS